MLKMIMCCVYKYFAFYLLSSNFGQQFSNLRLPVYLADWSILSFWTEGCAFSHLYVGVSEYATGTFLQSIAHHFDVHL